jgi:hypothetical protein
MDISELLSREVPSTAILEAEAKQIAEAKVILKRVQEVCEDLNILIDQLCRRMFEVDVHVEKIMDSSRPPPRVPMIFITAKRVLR